MKKTVVEFDLVGYSTISENFEQSLDVTTVAQLNQQIQAFIESGLKAVNATREENVMTETGDGAILVFDSAQDAHRFAEAVHHATRNHNQMRSQQLAKRIFRSGAATGEIVMKPKPGGGYDIAGTTIARAVRLEGKALPGAFLIDEATFLALSTEQRKQYGSKQLVHGKREEEFEAYAAQLNVDGQSDVEFFTSRDRGNQVINKSSLILHEATMNEFLYPTGQVIGGIRWQPNLVDVRLFLTTGDVAIQNLDLEIRLDDALNGTMGIADVKETSGIPCNLLAEMLPGVPALSRDRLFGPVKTGEKDNAITIPADVTEIISPMYRVQCPYLQKKSTLSLIIAAAEIERPEADAGGAAGSYIGVIVGNVADSNSRRFPQTISARGTFEIHGPNGIQVHQLSILENLKTAK